LNEVSGVQSVRVGGGTVPPAVRAHLTSKETGAVLRVQHEVLTAVRLYLSHEVGCIELPLPIIGPVTDPGARGAKQADVDYYGHRYKLMTSAILYKQAALLAAPRIFSIAPNVRLEPLETSSTGRHLAEFHQIDVELSGFTRTEAMAVAEGVVRSAVQHVSEACLSELEILGCDPAALLITVNEPFAKHSHVDIVEDLRALGHSQSGDAEIDWQNELEISQRAAAPFFIVDYPKGSRGFYDKESEQFTGVLHNFDLIAPDGFGELCSGSERESDYRAIVARMRETAENPAKYGWYLELVRGGLPASAGFGIGLERLVRWVTGRDYVWQATAFPKLPGVVAL